MFLAGRELYDLVALLFSAIFLEPIIDTAQSLRQEPQDSTLQMGRKLIPAIAFSRPTELPQFRQIEEILQNTDFPPGFTAIKSG